MIAAVVSPLLGAALVNGLCGALVLNDVPCGCDHGRERFYERECSRCAGSGFVAPSVTPGQHLDIATTRTDPDLQSDSPHMGGSWQWSWRKYPDRLGRAGARFDAEASAVLREGVHLGSVIGSVTATTPALPIVDARRDTAAPVTRLYYIHPQWDGDDGQIKAIDHKAEVNGMHAPPGTHGVTDLSEWLPWLGDDLVGRYAVLTTNPTRTTDECPGCDGTGGKGWVGDIRGGMPWEPCPICWPRGDDGEFAVVHESDFERNGVGKCPPVPLPDGVDHPAGTLTEVHW